MASQYQPCYSSLKRGSYEWKSTEKSEYPKMAGVYTPTVGAYYRNEGSGHVPSRGVGC
jgi:hypothetical protein